MPFLKNDVVARCVVEYDKINPGRTVREAAFGLGISKSTVHRDDDIADPGIVPGGIRDRALRVMGYAVSQD